MAKNSEIKLQFQDRDGKSYIFYKKNFDRHAKDHPELLESGYLTTIKNLICNCEPDMIYPSYRIPNSYVYESLAEGTEGVWYNKVVIIIKGDIYHIATAFRFRGTIREKQYGSCVTKRP